VRDHDAHIRGVVTELLDTVIPDGGCEFVEAVASRLPAIVIGDLLGYPRELWPLVRKWSEETMYQAGQTPADGHIRDAQEGMSESIMEFGATTLPIMNEVRTSGLEAFTAASAGP